MEWTDDAIVLSTRRYGENAAVACLLTREHGRHNGLVHGGGAKAARAALQTGNRLKVGWKARLSEQLGSFSWEQTGAIGAMWLADASRLAAVSAICAMAEAILPERENHLRTFEGMLEFLASLEGDDWPSLYVHWEMGLLAEVGYRLDLSCCAQSGTTEDLIYVSPKSGRAVSRTAGEPFRDKLLPLPAFLKDRTLGDKVSVQDGLRLTGYFLEKFVLSPHTRHIPAARSRLVERLKA